MVGIVVTISPNLSLYKIVVLPAASNPTANKNAIDYFVIFLLGTMNESLKMHKRKKQCRRHLLTHQNSHLLLPK